MCEKEVSTVGDVPQVKIGLIIPAAGKGERLQSSGIPKQYLLINGTPIIAETINGFLFLSKLIEAIVIPISLAYEYTVRTIIKQHVCEQLQAKIVIIEGRSSRHRSIMAGAKELDTFHVDLTIVHDAVRPIVDVKLVQQLLTDAREYGAAGAICKLSSTVLRKDDDSFMGESLKRCVHVESHTPQVFKQSLLLTAYNNASEDDLDNGTECLALAHKQMMVDGRSRGVKLVEGSSNVLWKVTHQKDLLYALHSYALANVSDDSDGPQSGIQVKSTHLSDMPSDVQPLFQQINCLFSSFSSTRVDTSPNGQSTPSNHIPPADERASIFSNGSKCCINVFMVYVKTQEDLTRILKQFTGNYEMIIFFLDFSIARDRIHQMLDQLRDSRAVVVVYSVQSHSSKSSRGEECKRLHQIVTSCLLHLSAFSGQIFFIGF